MTDNYKVQVSIAIPPSGSDYSKADMVNVRADSVAELVGHLLDIDEDTSRLVSRVASGLRAAAVAPLEAPQAQPQQQQPAGGAPTEPPPWIGPAPQCSHGVKRFLAKPYKSGKPGYWMAWACPANRGDQTQHELEFIQQGR